MSHLLELSEVEVQRAGRLVLTVPQLTLGAGEALGVIGPNGSGKSTLLQTIALLLPVAAGEIRLHGRSVSARRHPVAERRRLALVFQEPLLFDTSVYENVATGPRLRGIRGPAVDRQVAPWLDRFGLRELARRPARSLSGGEARRTSLARALASSPELLLLDEPFGSLDFPTHQGLLRDLPDLIRATGSAVILVSHDPRDIVALTKRAIALAGGRIVADGPAAVVTEAVLPIERPSGRGPVDSAGPFCYSS